MQPADVAVRRTGAAPLGRELSFPQVIGNEFAGVVDQVGEGVAGLAAGSEVIGFTTLSAYAELVAVSAEQVVPKPEGMPWEEAGALSASGQTAHTALEELGIGEDETVLIHAAAGGVGTMAVQLARARGAIPIGTASEANHEYLRSLGAIPVAYGDGLVERVRALAPRGIDAALDAIGGEALDASLELFADRSRIGTMGLGAEPQTYRGPNGVRRWFDSFDEIMDDIRFETHDFIAVGDRVVVPHSLHARGRATGIETEQYAVHVWHLRNGKAVKLELFATLDEALAAAQRR